MAITLADTYYIKALDNYPYNLEEMLENLTYALSYDDEHAEANTLMARFYTYQVPRYDLAKDYANKALASDPTCLVAFNALATVLMYSVEIEELTRVVNFVCKLKEANKSYFKGLLAQAYEATGKLKKAKRILKVAISKSVEDSTIEELETQLSRVKKKIKKYKKLTKYKKD